MVKNAEVKALFEQAFVIFKAHETQAETLQRQSMKQ